MRATASELGGTEPGRKLPKMFSLDSTEGLLSWVTGRPTGVLARDALAKGSAGLLLLVTLAVLLQARGLLAGAALFGGLAPRLRVLLVTPTTSLASDLFNFCVSAVLSLVFRQFLQLQAGEQKIPFAKHSQYNLMHLPCIIGREIYIGVAYLFSQLQGLNFF